MRFKRARELKRTRIEVIPMIDTMFFLLVFFMLSSLALTRINTLPVNLQAAAGEQVGTTPPVAITISAQGEYFVNNDRVTEEDFVERLRSALPNEEVTVLINADANAPNGQVIKAMDLARSAGVKKFDLATSGTTP